MIANEGGRKEDKEEKSKEKRREEERANGVKMDTFEGKQV
jgi:hypothetical protein